jgi:hypothetical protein
VTDHSFRRHNLVLDDVVGEVEQALKEHPVARHRLLSDRVAAFGGRALEHEAALGPDGNDERVLDHLGLHQAQDLGPEVLGPIRPTNPASRHLAPAQMHGLKAR